MMVVSSHERLPGRWRSRAARAEDMTLSWMANENQARRDKRGTSAPARDVSRSSYPKMAKTGIEKPRSSALNPLKFRPEDPPAEAGGKEKPAKSGLNGKRRSRSCAMARWRSCHMALVEVMRPGLHQGSEHFLRVGIFSRALAGSFLPPALAGGTRSCFFAIEARLSAASRHA